MTYDPAAVRRALADRQAAGLPLFDGEEPWPEARPAVVEQEALALPGATIRGNYVAWRATPEGAEVYQAFCTIAKEEVAAGRRLSAKGVWELVRAALRLPMNNSFVALAARDAETDHPDLLGRFEKRARSAA